MVPLTPKAGISRFKSPTEAAMRNLLSLYMQRSTSIPGRECAEERLKALTDTTISEPSGPASSSRLFAERFLCVFLDKSCLN